MRNVSVSILNFNGEKNTLECVESLKRIDTSKLKLNIIVIDNGSVEKLDLKNGQWGNTNLKVIRNEKNLGFSGGSNVAIRHALKEGSDYIVILNNDTYVDKKFIEEFVKVAEKSEENGILVPKIYFAPGYEFHKGKYKKEELGRVFWYAGGEMDWNNVIGHHRGVDEVDRGQYETTQETELATGCCMLIKKEVFEKIGLFDDKYFLYYEDADLSIKVKKKGCKIFYVPDSIIWHKNAGSAGGSGSKLQDYYITRNRLLFGIRYAPIRAKLALLKESVKIFFTGRYWQRRGVIDFYLGKLGRGSYKV